MKPEWWHGDWYLHRTHIASGTGDARREEDARAIISACPLVHSLHVNNSDRHKTMHIGGKEWPTLDARHFLYVKRYWDPENYDESYLKGLWIGELPTPEPPPKLWVDMMFQNLGVWL